MPTPKETLPTSNSALSSACKPLKSSLRLSSPSSCLALCWQCTVTAAASVIGRTMAKIARVRTSSKRRWANSMTCGRLCDRCSTRALLPEAFLAAANRSIGSITMMEPTARAAHPSDAPCASHRHDKASTLPSHGHSSGGTERGE